MIRHLECHDTVSLLTVGGALKVKKSRAFPGPVELDLRKAVRIGVELGDAVACSNVVFDPREVLLKAERRGDGNDDKDDDDN